MCGDEENVSAKLDIVVVAAGEQRPGEGHLLDEDGEAVAGGGKVELQVAPELRPARPGAGGEEAGVEAEDGHHLLLHVDAGLAAVRVAHPVQSEVDSKNKTYKLVQSALHSMNNEYIV